MVATMVVDPCIKLSHRKIPLVRTKAKILKNTFMVAGRAPCGVTLLGTTDSVSASALKVKFF